MDFELEQSVLPSRLNVNPIAPPPPGDAFWKDIIFSISQPAGLFYHMQYMNLKNDDFIFPEWHDLWNNWWHYYLSTS